VSRPDRAPDPLPLTGGCACGVVRYEVTAPLTAASWCHCTRCQRRSGSAASPNAHPPAGAFRVVAGEERLRMWKPGDGGEKWFCGDCGSSLFARNPSHADPIGIRMGTFDGDPGIRPTVRQFVASAAAWEQIPDDGLPRHPGSRHATRPSIAPQLAVRRGRAAIDFYTAAFGAAEVYRVGGTDEHESVVAQLVVGDATFWVSDEAPEHGTFSPETVGGGTVRMLLVVADPDAAVRRAVAAGATELAPVGDQHGWRLGRLVDPFGHHWEVGRPLVPWPPAPGGP
jgi:PhnB protein